MAITIKLKPTTINQSGKNPPVQFAELNDTSFCNLLYLIWPQPMRLEIPWKLKESAVIEKYQVSDLENLTLNVPVMPSFFSCLLHFLMESCDESVFL